VPFVAQYRDKSRPKSGVAQHVHQQVDKSIDQHQVGEIGHFYGASISSGGARDHFGIGDQKGQGLNISDYVPIPSLILIVMY